MNRVIKFRAWNEAEKAMIYPVEKIVTRLEYERNGYNTYWVHGEWIADEVVLGATCTLGNPIMQFTGLTDANGVEIYEGDIIRDGAGNLGVVVFMNGAFTCKVPGMSGFRYLIKPDKMVIKGNIREHPELLPK